MGSFAGLHLLQGLAEMARRQMVLSGSAEGGGIVYRTLEQISTLLRYFLAGPSLDGRSADTLSYGPGTSAAPLSSVCLWWL